MGRPVVFGELKRILASVVPLGILFMSSLCGLWSDGG